MVILKDVLNLRITQCFLTSKTSRCSASSSSYVYAQETFILLMSSNMRRLCRSLKTLEADISDFYIKSFRCVL